MLFGRVVYQDVDLAELLHGLLDSFSTELFLADITCDQQTFAPVFFHQTPGFIRVLVLFEIDNRNVRTFFRKGNRNRAANPAVPASNERHFVSQFSTAAMLFVLGPRGRLHIVFAAGLSLLMLRRLKFLLLGHTEILRVMDFVGFFSEERHLKLLSKPRRHVIGGVFAHLWLHGSVCVKVFCHGQRGPSLNRAWLDVWFALCPASAEATLLQPAAPSRGRWRSPAQANVHHVHLPEYVPFLRGRIRRPVWTAICLRVRLRAPA